MSSKPSPATRRHDVGRAHRAERGNQRRPSYPKTSARPAGARSSTTAIRSATPSKRDGLQTYLHGEAVAIGMRAAGAHRHGARHPRPRTSSNASSG